MATQGQDYVDYVKFAAGKRLSVETHVGGSIDNILSAMEQANAVYPIEQAEVEDRAPEQRASRPTRSSTGRRRSASAGR